MATNTSANSNGIVVKPCSIKTLPSELWTAAAAKAIEVNPANAPAVHQLRMALPGVVIAPEHLAVLTSKYWGAGGVHLTVGFLDNPPADLRGRILSHMNSWSAFANVSFTETSQNPQVRISRTAGGPTGGYWSYLGTDVLLIEADKPTMNLDSFTMNTPDSEFFRVVRHETGHTLAFPHEHKRTEIVNGIDFEKAIAYFMSTQGWSRDEVIEQVLTPIDQSALIATQQADVQSIMCYWLPAEIMKNNVAVPGGTDIDPLDAQFAASVYPKPGQSSKASPSVAAFNNLLWVAFIANNDTNNVLVCSSAEGQTWTDNIPIGQAAKNGTAASLIVFKNQLWVAFIANNNTNDILVCSSADGHSWTNNTRINQAGKGNESPSLTVFNNQLWVSFVANNTTNDILVCSSADGHNWTNNTRLNQAAQGGTSATVAVFSNRLWAAFVANNSTNDILVCSSPDGHSWTNNTRINQAAKGGTSPSLAVFNNRLWVCFIANNSTNDVLVCSSADGSNWTNNTRINQAGHNGTSPSLAVFNNRLWVSFIANNETNSVLICSSTDGSQWTNNVII